MTSTVTGIYASPDQVRNAEEDLIASGIPREQIFVDEPVSKLRVIVAEATRPGIEEILERHGLKLAPTQAAGPAA